MFIRIRFEIMTFRSSSNSLAASLAASFKHVQCVKRERKWLGQAGANTTLTWINLATEQVHLKKLHTHEREIFMVQRCMDRTFVKLAPFSIFTSGKKRSENVLVTRMKENRNRRAKKTAFSNCRSFDLWFSDGQKAIMPTFRVTRALFYSPFPWMKRFPPSDFSGLLHFLSHILKIINLLIISSTWW